MKMAKRQQAARQIPENAKRVCIEKVIPAETPKLDGEESVSHPMLVTFASQLAPTSVQDIKLELVKRKETSHDEVLEPEMLGRAGGRQWHARKGFHGMNSDYFVGVRNKTTGKLTLVETDGLYCMRPPTGNQTNISDDDSNSGSEMEDENNNDRTYAEQRSDLIRLFGGNKSKKLIAKYEKDRVTEDKVDEKVKRDLSSAASAMKKKDSAKGIHHGRAGTSESMAPPHNSAATDPSDAFPLEGLVTPVELIALKNEATLVVEAEAAEKESDSSMENPGWDPLVWDTLMNIVANKNIAEELMIRRLQAAMHLHYLIVLCKYKGISGSDREQMIQDMAVDEAVLECLLERYSVRFGGHRLRRHRNHASITRSIDYGILMWLTASGFENCGRLGELSTSLGTNVKTLITQAVQLGCKVRKTKGQTGPDAYRLSLKAPLVFPEIRKKGRTPRKS